MKSKQNAFTLIELLVVIAIIGLLASAVLVSMNSARLKSRDAKRSTDIQNTIKGLELYFSSNNTYPIYGTSGTTYNLRTALNGATPAVSPTYVNPVPRDPLYAGQTQDYQYYWTNNGRDYAIRVWYEGDNAYCQFKSNGAPLTGWSSAPLCKH